MNITPLEMRSVPASFASVRDFSGIKVLNFLLGRQRDAVMTVLDRRGTIWQTVSFSIVLGNSPEADSP
ncbi:MAG: hypothetical protein U0872_14350 [Planctomycetaceae bacterium]